MKIHQIYTQSFLRNFTYLIELDDHSAMVIDPWEEVVVNSLLAEKNLRLTSIINTHEHWDHTQGNEALVTEHGCEVWAHKNGQGKIPGLTRVLSTGEIIDLEPGVQLQVLNTPGHTFAHLCFLVLEQGQPKAVFTGDTLFNAGVGNCTNGGDAEVMYQTIVEQFHSLNDNVTVYPGHEYLENNLRFTLSMEPNNTDAQAWLVRAVAADPTIEPLTTTIGDERQLNAFFRLDNAVIRSAVDCSDRSDKEVFVALRSRRDNW
ncbi:MAG: hydroxyacylglutathione hydrolase [Porticoccaceae bacterium]|jgi:hydroxyacylglutathione hydrolase|tara:strand:- start:378 stop:1157 length:780 start_codon:yes stop_codon:yes gene_type:complete